MGDGSLHAKGIRFCVAQKDHDVVQRLCYLRHRLFGIEAERKSRTSYTELIFTSIRLVLWWEACGLAKTPPTPGHRGKGYPPRVPDAILHTNDPDVYAAFIRGLFEADGTVHNGYVSWTTSTLQFSYDVLRLLLALGFETTREYEHPSP